MDKGKLKFSRIGKKGTITAILLALALNCSAEVRKAPKSTPFAYEVSEQNIENTLQSIFRNNLNQQTEYDRLEAKVQNEVAGLLSKMNADSLSLAHQYKSVENQNFSHLANYWGLSKEQTKEKINKITASNFKGTSDDVNLKIVSIAVPHYMHMCSETLYLIRVGATEAQFSYLDEGDQHNEYLLFNTKGKRNISGESTTVLSFVENDILNYAQYCYKVKEKNGEKVNSDKITKQISGNMQKIKTQVAKISSKGYNKKEYNELVKLINSTAELLPEEMFGAVATRRVLLTEFASQYAMNNLLTKVTGLGYEVNNIKPSVFVEQDKKTTLDMTVRSNTTNNHQDFGLNIKGNTPLPKNWNITYGGEFNFIDVYGQDKPEYQVLGDLGFGKTFKNGSSISLSTKAGVQFNEKNVSFPLGLNAAYNIRLSESLSLVTGIDTSMNLTNNKMGVGGFLGIKVKTNSLNMSVNMGGGYEFDLSKTNTTPEPQKPTYESDDVIPQNPDDIIEKGDGKDLEETPIDIGLF